MAQLTDAALAECEGDFSVTHTRMDIEAYPGRVYLYTWLYAIGVQLCAPYNLSRAEWSGSVRPFLNFGRSMQEDAFPGPLRPSQAFPSPLLAFRPEDPENSLTELTLDSDAVLVHGFPGADYGTADFWMAAPQMPNRWYMLGDLSKFVPMSRQRVAHMGYVDPIVNVSLVGDPGELVEITMAFKEASGIWKLCLTKVAIGADGTGSCPMGSMVTCDKVLVARGLPSSPSTNE